MSRLLEVSNLDASYGQSKVLFNIAFDLEEGGITAILGANGAGKTTTLRALCQICRTSGSIRFDGKELVGMATEDVVRMGVAHVPDGRGTFTELSVRSSPGVQQDLRYAALALNTAWYKAIVGEWLSVGLRGAADVILGDARLRLADPGTDARLVVVAEHPIRPAARRQRRLVFVDQLCDRARVPARRDEAEVERQMCA